MRTGFLRVIVVVFLAMTSSSAFAQKRPLILAAHDYPPYVIVHDGKPPSGIMIDIWNEVSRRMGQEVRFEIYPLQREIMLLEQGLIDGLFSIKKTPDRERRFLYPKEPLMLQDHVFFVLKDSNIDFRGNLSSFANVSIGVVSKVSYGEVFDTAVATGVLKKIDPAASYDLDFRMLLNKRVEAIICSRFVGISILKRMGALDQTRIAGIPVETVKSYVIFGRKTVEPSVTEAFDKAISSMRKDGTIKSIERKYLN